MTRLPALILAAAATLAAPFANAALTLQELFDGACLTDFGVRACNWGSEYDFSDVLVDYDNIDVFLEQANSSFGPAISISYEFNGEFHVADGDAIDLGFFYSLTVHGGTDFLEVELTDVVFEGTGGFIRVVDSKFVDDVLVGEVILDSDFGPFPVGAVVFDQPYKHLWNEKNILIQSYAGGEVSVGDMHQKQTVPLPGTLALLAGGLAGVAAVRRRRAGAATRA
jgi:hypothetical protein